MRQHVRVPELEAVGRERPVVLRRARVVVLEKRHRAGRNPPEQSGRPRGGVAETPKLGVFDGSLQDPFGGKVEERARAVGFFDPVHQPRSRPVLVVGKRRALPVHVHPVLAHVENRVLDHDVHRVEVFLEFFFCLRLPPRLDAPRLGRESAPDVLLDVLRREPSHEIEPEPPEPDLVPQPRHPALQREPELGVGVVQIRRGAVVLARIRTALPVERGVVAGDGPLAPVHGLAVRVQVRVHVPRAFRADGVRGAVVDHHVAHGSHAPRAERSAQRHEVVFASVPARVELEQTTGEVPLRARALARGRQPEVRDTERRDGRSAFVEPSPVGHGVLRLARVKTLRAGPVEALREDHASEGVVRASAGARAPHRDRHEVLYGGVGPVVQRRRLQRVVPLEHVVLPEVIEHVAVVRVAADARLAVGVRRDRNVGRSARFFVRAAQARELGSRDLGVPVRWKVRRRGSVPRRRRRTRIRRLLVLLAVQPGGYGVDHGGVPQRVHLHGGDFFVGVRLRVGRGSGVLGRVRVALGVHDVRPRVPHLPVARRGDPRGVRGGVRVVLVVRTGPAVREGGLVLLVEELVALVGRDARGRGVGVLAALGSGGDAREATRTRNAMRARVRTARRARARGGARRERRARAGGEHSGPRGGLPRGVRQREGEPLRGERRARSEGCPESSPGGGRSARRGGRATRCAAARASVFSGPRHAKATTADASDRSRNGRLRERQEKKERFLFFGKGKIWLRATRRIPP